MSYLKTVRKGYPSNSLYGLGLGIQYNTLFNDVGSDFRSLKPYEFQPERVDYTNPMHRVAAASHVNTLVNNFKDNLLTNSGDHFGLVNKEGEVKKPTGEANFKLPDGSAMLLGGLAGAVGNAVGSAIRGGYSTGGVGECITMFGNRVGTGLQLVPGLGTLLGPAVKAASGIIGGIVDRGWGVKTDQTKLNAVNEGINYYKNQNFNANNFDDIKGLTAYGFQNPYKNGWFTTKVNPKNAEAHEAFDYAKNFAERGWENAANNLIYDLTAKDKATLVALGGPIETVDPTSAIGYAIHTDDYIKDMSKNNNKGLTNMFAGIPNSMFAFGGNVETKGSTFSDGLTHIDNGGSHEESPYDGVLVGVDSQNVPNLVEEGEVIYKDYVFSNRLTVPKGRRGNYGKRNKFAKGGKLNKTKGDVEIPYEDKVLKPFEGLTFAEAAKKVEKQSGVIDRPNDPIAQRGFELTLSVLASVQEKEREKDKLQEIQDSIDNMTPEEFAMLQQQMQANQAAQALQEAMVQQQLMIPQGMEYMLQPVEEQLPIAALGGLLNSNNKFKYGGNLEKFTNELRNKGLTIEDYLDYFASTQNKDRGTLRATDEGFNKDVAEQYLKHVDKIQREVDRRYKKEGLNPKNLTGAGLEAYQRDVVAAARGTALDGDLSINGFNSTNRGDSKLSDFNKYSYTRNTKQNLIAEGATDLKTNAQGLFDINYGIENPTGLTYVTGMPKWNTSSKQWEDAEGKKIDNPFGEDTKFSDVTGGGYNSAFENQDDLSRYYKEQLTKRFQNLKELNYDEKKLPSYYLSNKELKDWIGKEANGTELGTGLLGSSDKKERELGKLLKANWDLDANLGTLSSESQAYRNYLTSIGRDLEKAGLQWDHKPGIEHIPYLGTIPYSAVRYREVDTDNNPTDNYVNWDPANPTAGFSVIEQPLSTEGGVTTYCIKRNNLVSNVGVLPDGTYLNLTPEQAALYKNNKIEDPSALPKYAAPLKGYSHTPTYYDLSKDAAGNLLGVKKGNTDNIPFPEQTKWPWYAAAGILGLGLLHNIFSPRDYKNAEALISKLQNNGAFRPVTYNPLQYHIHYKPDDPWFYTSPIIAQSNATQRAIVNKVSPSKGAETLANSYNTMLALGKAQREALEHNFDKELKVASYKTGVDEANSKGFLQADIANQDAATRLSGLNIAGYEKAYAMQQAIDNARADSISGGIKALTDLATLYGQTLDYNKLLRYRADTSIDGSGIYFDKDKSTKAKGGKLRRKKKGLSF